MGPAMRGGRTERLAAALIARHDFAAAARVLNGAGIIPMPLKGVLLQHIVYPDPSERVLSDADLLVPPGRWRDAVAALRRAGYRIHTEGRAAAVAKAPRARLEVDVHRRLFSPGLYRLSASDLFARGTLEPKLFDAVVVVPAPLDLYAHLVGNFAKGRHAADDQAQLRDLSAVASRFSLAPELVARHLERHGLGRAARYTLAYAAESGDTFAARVLARLRGDPLGASLASIARGLTDRFGGSARASLVAPHLVNTTLPRGAASVIIHIGLGLRERFERVVLDR